MTEHPNNEKQLWVRNLVQQHQTPLVRYARSIVKDEHLARDVVQDTFLKLCNQSQSDLVGHEAAWLFRVCHNCALNRHRKDKRMNTSSEMTESIANESSTQCVVVKAEEHEQLSQLIEELTENQQKVVRLKFHSGLKYREISAATGLSESNVGFLLHKALQSMRKQMERLDIAPS